MMRKGYSVPMLPPSEPEQESQPVVPADVPPPKRVKAEKPLKIADSLQAFDTFWEAYPKRCGKVAVLKCWKRINPDAALVEKIMTAIAKQKTWRKWIEGYIPNPLTWLNQGRWDDEPDGKVKPAVPAVSDDEYKAQLAEQRRKAKEEEAEVMRRINEEGTRQDPVVQPEVSEEDRELFEAFLE
jgi:hypothetical protein